MDQPPVRVFLRPIGSPLTIGMSGLAIASFVVSGLDLSWVSKNQTLEIGWILVAVPFVLQLVACVFSYLARDGATGAAVGLLSTTWLALGLIHIVSPTSTRSGAMGLLLLIAAGTLAASAVAVASAKLLPGAVFALAAARFTLAGIFELGGASVWQHIAGILGLVVAGLAVYSVLAFELEGQQHQPVLPTLRVRRGREALLGDFRQQIDGVSGEAGVRQTS